MVEDEEEQALQERLLQRACERRKKVLPAELEWEADDDGEDG